MIVQHYIELVQKQQKEIEQLRTTLFEVMMIDKLSKVKKQIIIDKFFTNDTEQ